MVCLRGLWKGCIPHTSPGNEHPMCFVSLMGTELRLGMSLVLVSCACPFPGTVTGRYMLGLYPHFPGLEQDNRNGAWLLLWAGGCLEELLLSPWTSPENRNKETRDAHVTLPPPVSPSHSRALIHCQNSPSAKSKPPQILSRKIPSLHAVLHAKFFT